MVKEADRYPTHAGVHSGAAERNTAPIIEVLKRVLPSRGTVLEIASGTGQHVVAFASNFPALDWQPSDIDPGLRACVEQRIAVAGLVNIAAPIALDASRQPWAVGCADAMICINMIHISPWSATAGLFEGARRLLPCGGVLVTYGPYMRGGQHTAPSNAAFDRSLRERNPKWGIRDIDDIVSVASKGDIDLVERVPMPANNFALVFRAR